MCGDYAFSHRERRAEEEAGKEKTMIYAENALDYPSALSILTTKKEKTTPT